jgi:predicted secreted acid phosphatase
MRRCCAVLLLLCGFAALVCAQNRSQSIPDLQEPENLAGVIDRLVRYHDFGEYDYQIRQVASAARDYLDARVKAALPNEKLAAVFDIDETSLSNWETMSDCGFCAYSAQLKLYPPPAHDPAIQPTLELFKFAQEHHVAVFFVTGRQEKQRAATESNLVEAGYSHWDGLYMQIDGNKEPASVFKPRNRRQIMAKGYKIVLSIGDQFSDLAGCCAERVFKLPNPFYLIK